MAQIIFPRAQLARPLAGARLNRDHPFAQGLVLLYTFGEGYGTTVRDATGKTGSGTITAAAWRVGEGNLTSMTKYSNRPDFAGLLGDGSTTYVDCGASPSLSISGSNPISLEAIVTYTGTPSGGVFPRIISNADANNGYELLLHDTSSAFAQQYYLQAIQGGSYNTAVSTDSAAVIPTGRRSHVVGTYDGTTGAIYLDGSLLATSAFGANAIGTASLNTLVGRQSGSAAQFWPGSIYKIAIYNRVLTYREIVDLYQNPWSMMAYPAVRARSWAKPPSGLLINPGMDATRPQMKGGIHG